MIVLEVLHDEDGSFETIDLTDRVVQRIEQGDDQEEDALMGGFGQDEDTEEDADAEQDNGEGAVW
ncbi:hypothetical protein ACERK3_05660 [Phycisphaerales bacterium AB-hyl4]|uniref:Uncharacterized protein n=1 Tax=Natronomicrosphaera hydrolytica TaxID=3242702 RepID=A0ABV4U2G8_9BACT